jgi:hypothetical protein
MARSLNKGKEETIEEQTKPTSTFGHNILPEVLRIISICSKYVLDFGCQT